MTRRKFVFIDFLSLPYGSLVPQWLGQQPLISLDVCSAYRIGPPLLTTTNHYISSLFFFLTPNSLTTSADHLLVPSLHPPFYHTIPLFNLFSWSSFHPFTSALLPLYHVIPLPLPLSRSLVHPFTSDYFSTYPILSCPPLPHCL